MSRRRFLEGAAASLAGVGITMPGEILAARNAASPTIPKIAAYRTLGRTGFKCSDIGFGSAELADAALFEAILDSGVNYIDCAETYFGGQVERLVGSVLKTRDRASIFLTTKLAVRKNDPPATVKARALKCLERLNLGYVDCLMIHAPATRKILKTPGFHQAVTELKAEGRVRFCGVSNHGAQWFDVPETMEQVLLAAADDGRFDCMLFVYNFIQREMGERILAACKAKNIGATLMKTNPVSNSLEVQEQVDRLRDEGKTARKSLLTLAERLKSVAEGAEPFRKSLGLKGNAAVRDAAVKFVLSNPSVSAACLTIKNFDELKAYVSLSGRTLSAAEMRLLEAYASSYGRLYCRHACGLCEHRCPHGVPVNTVMRYAHYVRAQGRTQTALSGYAGLRGVRADMCPGCEGYCESACPYGVPVQGLLALAHDLLRQA